MMEQKQATIPVRASAVEDKSPLIKSLVINIDPASIIPLDPNVLPPQLELEIDDPPSHSRGVVPRCSLWASLFHWSLARYIALISSWYIWLWIYRFTPAAGHALWIVWLCCFPFIQTMVVLIHSIGHCRETVLRQGSIYLCAMPQSCTNPKWPLVDALLVRERHADMSLLVAIVDLVSQTIALGVLGALFSEMIEAEGRSSVFPLAIASFAIAGIVCASTRIGPCCVRGGLDVREYFSEHADEDRLLYLCKLCRAAELRPPFTTRSLFIAWVSSVNPLWRREWCGPPPQHVASALLAQSPIALQYLTWLTRN